MKHPTSPPKLFRSLPHPCPYLPQTASMVVLEPDYLPQGGEFSHLMRTGFRRSGRVIYKPHCRTCRACVSVRIPVAAFRPNRAQRRTERRNADLTCTVLPAYFSTEHFHLYCRYQAWRHPNDAMNHADPKLYYGSMVESNVDTRFIEYRLGARLVALSVFDGLDDGLSAVYTFFDPEFEARSLGTYAILRQVEYARELGREWLYLGYWISGCRKMDYKVNFRPLAGFRHGRWGSLLGERTPA